MSPPRGSGRRSIGVAGLSGSLSERIALWLLLTLLLLCALGGGSSFADTTSLLYVRPAAVLCLLIFLLLPGPFLPPFLRIPAVLLAALAILTAIQLIPLPPSIWTALPGRSSYLAAATIAGMPQPWRPVSLTPDLTWNSLVALVVPAAMLIGIGRINRTQLLTLVPVFIILCCLSAMIGIAQFAGGPGNPLYWYKRMGEGLPDGLLANRNHQAVMLALVFPALRVWIDMPARSQEWHRRRPLLALAIGLAILPVILATGSRAGLVITAASILLSLIAFPHLGQRFGRFAGLLRFVLPAVFVLMVAGSYILGRAVSIDRLSGAETITSDQRFQYAPVVNRIIRSTFPVGTGQGSFDPLYRQYEPDVILDERYANHAHNDLQEIVMTLGLGGALLVVAFVIWLVRQAVAAFAMRSRSRSPSPAMMSARLAVVAISLVCLASLVDYPLRTPLFAAIFTIFCSWLSLVRYDDRVQASAN